MSREADSKWTEEHKLEAHSDWVRDVAWAPSVGLGAQSTVASCSQDHRVILWTSQDGSSWTYQVLATFDDVIWHVSWSVTGNILAVSGGDNKVSPPYDWSGRDAPKEQEVPVAHFFLYALRVADKGPLTVRKV